MGRVASRLLDVFLIRQDEVRLVLLLGGNIFLSINALIVSQIVGESLFLSAHGREVLVYIYGAGGLSAALAGVLYASAQRRIRTGLFEQGVLGLCIAIFAAFWMLSVLGHRQVFVPLLIFAEVFATLSILQAWNITTALLTVRSAKRLVPVVGGCGSLAGVSAGLTVGALAEQLGTVNLLGVVILALFGSIVLTGQLLRRAASAPAVGPAARSRRSSKRDAVPVRDLFANNLFRVVLGITVLATLASIFVDYQFKVFSQAHFTVNGALDRDALSEFYGYFQLVVTTFVIVLQLGIASRMLEVWGLATALVLLPLVILLGTGAILFGIGGLFLAASVARGGDKALRFSVYGSTHQILYLALPDPLQARARTVATGVVRPATIVLASVLLVLLIEGIGIDDAAVSYVTAPVALAWVVLSLTAGHVYLSQLLRTTERRRISFHKGKARITDEAAIDEIASSLGSDAPVEVLEALSLLERVPETTRNFSRPLAALLGQADTRVVCRALEVGRLKNYAMDEGQVAGMLTHASPQVRVEAVQSLGRLQGRRTLVDGLLADCADPLMHNAAIEVAATSADPSVRESALRIMDQRLCDPSAQTRLAVLDTVAILNQKEATQRILRVLDDPDPGVRDRAARLAVCTDDARVRWALLNQLRAGTARPASVDAFAAGGDLEVGVLREVLLKARQPGMRQLAAAALGAIGSESALDVLLARMRSGAGPPSIEASRAAVRIVRAGRHALPRARVKYILEDIYRYLYQLAAWQVDTVGLRQGDSLGLLDALVADRRRRGLEVLFQTLRLTYAAMVIDIAERGLADRSPKVRDNAIEILGQTLAQVDKRAILPLLELDDPSARLAAGGRYVRVQRLAPDAWLDLWTAGEDPWLCAAALWALGRTQGHAYDRRLRDLSLNATHPVIRETAVLVASRNAGGASLEALFVRLLDDPDEAVRLYARDLLAPR